MAAAAAPWWATPATGKADSKATGGTWSARRRSLRQSSAAGLRPQGRSRSSRGRKHVPGLWLALFLAAAFGSPARAELCDVTTGQQNIILDITESRGDQVDQLTVPTELPLEGTVGSDVLLELSESGKKHFVLNGKRLQLVHPLERDEEDLSTLILDVECQAVAGSGQRRTVPVIVRITDVNDNAPVFRNAPYSVSVPESTSVGTTVFKGVEAHDKDSGVNGQVEYSILPGDGSASDGSAFFSINLPHQGQVTVKSSLDFETTSEYQLTILASDLSIEPGQRLTASTVLTVTVTDSDDKGPAFSLKDCTENEGSSCLNPEYTASVTSGEVAGVLDVFPEKIHAHDQDALNAPIRYAFMSGTPPHFDAFFSIDARSGVVTQTRPADSSQTPSFNIDVKATEQTDAQRYATAKLIITVRRVDMYPPEIEASAYTGNVDENSSPGTQVFDDHPDPRPIQLTASDPDFTIGDPQPEYTWELTSSSFKVTSEGYLVVNEAGLDRDPPNTGLYTIQVVAREKSQEGRASAPITLTVVLNDVNDNAPQLPVLPPVTVQAGDAVRKIGQVTARDKDEGPNAVVTYDIAQVSNNGGEKFVINATSGLLEVVGPVEAGEQFSVVIRATDQGGLNSQSIQEVMVAPGPNTGGPAFSKSREVASISEGAAIDSVVTTVQAVDPEGDLVRYSIVSGNSLGHFEVGELTGSIRVTKALDREKVGQYILVVRAEDREGLANTVTVVVKVLDINDKSPEFEGLPYVFRVNEGDEGAVVGRVMATDADDGDNARIYYSVPDETPFSIDELSGEIVTKSALDFETQQVHLLLVTAKDGGEEPRLATASVTVLVSDQPDEPPLFLTPIYEATVAENEVDAFVVAVNATDPDSQPSVTYALVGGDTDAFKIDPSTGRIVTARPLDYETSTQHSIVVGTLENPNRGPQATCSVLVTVEDRNDHSPVFTIQPPPVTIYDGLPVGASVSTVVAVDADGTAPFNEVYYALGGIGLATDYFEVDQQGIILVKADLSTQPEEDFQLEVVATDGGDPALSGTLNLLVTVEHPVTLPPEEGAGFAEAEHLVEVEEDLKPEGIVKKLALVNKPKDGAAIKCDIISGNDLGHFEALMSTRRECEVRVAEGVILDRETLDEYHIVLELVAARARIDSTRKQTKMTIHLQDVNDNAPVFQVPVPEGLREGARSSRTYYAFVSEDARIHTSVITVKATDEDLEENGRISYEILPESNRGGFFSVNSEAGVIRTARLVSEASSNLLPFNLTMVAVDNPINKEDYFMDTVPVVVNVVRPEHRLVLVVEAPPDRVSSSQGKLIHFLQEQSKKIVGIERVESLQFVDMNGTTTRDGNRTDVWFHVVEPRTGRILERDHPALNASVTGPKAMTNLKYYSKSLQLPINNIRPPVLLAPVVEVTKDSFGKTHKDLAELEISLIVLAAVIVLLGVIGIAYVCHLWSRYVEYRDEVKPVVVLPPQYEPVGSVIEPINKQYEVQVLSMSVPLDDDSVTEVPLDNGSHYFSMDNVSYITKEELSENALGFRGSPMAHRFPGMGDGVMVMGDSSGDETPNIHSTTAHRNPSYERFADEEDDHGPLSISATNENVMFGGRLAPMERSPIETTTEL
ncbi:cadherin 99C [Oratosquilla oratoria]|uniref:cadherin 99C n=1 Tax=Oratosquilla oratoria TaxID=337810 RepID=UPI003F76F789